MGGGREVFRNKIGGRFRSEHGRTDGVVAKVLLRLGAREGFGWLELELGRNVLYGAQRVMTVANTGCPRLKALRVSLSPTLIAAMDT